MAGGGAGHSLLMPARFCLLCQQLAKSGRLFPPFVFFIQGYLRHALVAVLCTIICLAPVFFFFSPSCFLKFLLFSYFHLFILNAKETKKKRRLSSCFLYTRRMHDWLSVSWTCRSWECSLWVPGGVASAVRPCYKYRAVPGTVRLQHGRISAANQAILMGNCMPSRFTMSTISTPLWYNN